MAFSASSSSSRIIPRSSPPPPPGFSRPGCWRSRNPPLDLNKRPDENEDTFDTSTELLPENRGNQLIINDPGVVAPHKNTFRYEPVILEPVHNTRCDFPRIDVDQAPVVEEPIQKNGSESGVSSSSVNQIKRRRGRRGRGRRDDGRLHGIPLPDGSIECPRCHVVFTNKKKYSIHTKSHYSSESKEEKTKRLAARTARSQREYLGADYVIISSDSE